MKKRISLDELIALVEGDRELVYLLIEERIVTNEPAGFCLEDVDRVLVSRTLLRDLEVNSAGLDIILRLRQELASALRRIHELERHRSR